MNDEYMDAIVEDLNLARFSAQSAMRGSISTVGIEKASGIAAAELGESLRDAARIEGIIRAAYEAGKLHQLNSTRDAEIVASLARQSEFYAANPRVDATPQEDES